MTLALQLVRHRRIALLCAATVLLHYVAVRGVDGGARAPQPQSPPRAPVAVVAELRVASPPPETQASALAQAREAGVAGAPVSERQVQSVNSAGPTRPPAVAEGSHRVDLPPSAQLSFGLVRAGSSGAASSGESVLDWHRGAANYTLRYEAWLSGTPVGSLAEMSSEGRIGKAGIMPRTLTDRRRGRARTATHFNERGTRATITFSAAQGAVPTQAGAQDKASWPLQLAGIARAGTSQLAAGVEMLVGESRRATLYRFVVLGPEELVTGMGTLATWRLARLAQPGSYDARLDIWLAPDHQWYPVQLRSTESNGTVTTQTIRGIVVKEAGN